MKKLIKGIVEFRKNVLPGYREKFANLALGQSPDTLFICCSDSRVAPNVFASTDPGDLFVIRNPGNLVSACDTEGRSKGDVSEVAALEFALLTLKVKNIIVCGHSECGAVNAVCQGIDLTNAPHLKSWLVHANDSLEVMKSGRRIAPHLPFHNEVSQLNVLQQLEHLKTYPLVRECIDQGKVQLHGWWFDIAKADVYAYELRLDRFVLIDEAEGQDLLSRLA